MWGLDKPGCGVSTLEALARQTAGLPCPEPHIVCAVMDARRGQVYNALFSAGEGGLVRLCEDRAIGLDELRGELERAGKRLVLAGDGAELCFSALRSSGLKALSLAPENLRYQNAWGVALAAAEIAEKPERWEEPEPVYLRMPQAERERLEREKR